MGSWISRVLWGTPSDEKPIATVQEQVEPRNEQVKCDEKPKADVPKPSPSTVSAKPTIDRSIFIQRNKTDETIERVSGQINGNQFVASDLKNCKVIVRDFCDSMTFDRCVNSDFVLSAVRGSIFVRDCSNCKFIMICGQFRCRSCQDCDFFMHVKTGPVVESSTNLKIGCAELSYPDMYTHMEKAGLPKFQNIWNDVHDFTPGPGHFEYVPGEHLRLDISGNEPSLVPFTYMRNAEKQYFKVKVPSLEALLKVTHSENIHAINIEETGSEFSFEVEGADQASVDSLVAELI